MRLRTALPLVTALLGCRPETSAQNDSHSGRQGLVSPTRLVYSARPLDASDTLQADAALSEWSQNDYHDTLVVELLGADVALVDTVLVLLEGRIVLAGDQYVRDSTRKTIPWPVARAELSQKTVGAGQITVLQPTVLWDYFKAQAGSSFVIDSVRTTIALRNGTKLSTSIALLWD